MNNKYKYLVFVLIIVLFIDISGYLFYFNFSIISAKQENLEKILNADENYEFEIITINKSDLRNLVLFIDKNEIIYKGVLYDVYKIKENDEQISFYCIRDDKETDLVRSYSNFISKTKNVQDKKNKVNNLLVFFTLGLNYDFLYQPDNNYSVRYFASFNNFIQKIYLIPPVPPPRFIV